MRRRWEAVEGGANRRGRRGAAEPALSRGVSLGGHQKIDGFVQGGPAGRCNLHRPQHGDRMAYQRSAHHSCHLRPLQRFPRSSLRVPS